MPERTFNEAFTDAKARQGSTNGHYSRRGPESYETVRRASLVNLEDVAPKAVRWLWDKRIPRGKFTLFVGDPGLGKSQATIDLIARHTSGKAWPGDLQVRKPENAIILSAEDDLADTVRPRLEASGGDVRRVKVLRSVQERVITTGAPEIAPDDIKWKDKWFNLGADLPLLADAAEECGASLVVIDPLSSYFGGTDTHTDADVRGVLGPLSDLAARLEFAAVGVLHLNKGSGRPAQYRVGGSIAFVAAARAAHVFVADPDDRSNTRRLFLPLKQNLSKPADGLAFTIEGYVMDYGDGVVVETSRVAWQPGVVDLSAQDALADEKSRLEEAMEFLRETLADGPVSSKTIQSEARELQLPAVTLRRAKEALGIRARKQPKTSDPKQGWVWELPEPKQDIQPENTRIVEHLEQVEHLGRNQGTQGVQGNQEFGVFSDEQDGYEPPF